ncbi:hypothetical protein [Phocoenobacter skyensis]|uniref:hypothetical protein n=1 Tax=Phocoenobacter skyensis TaxID=97481 RepID=UPI002757946B|nr:hypothetical protein [Pasteurella skyensis]MDP8185300.1 hypothetical protein [Pasteurella skyensis]
MKNFMKDFIGFILQPLTIILILFMWLELYVIKRIISQVSDPYVVAILVLYFVVFQFLVFDVAIDRYRENKQDKEFRENEKNEY